MCCKLILVAVILVAVIRFLLLRQDKCLSALETRRMAPDGPCDSFGPIIKPNPPFSTQFGADHNFGWHLPSPLLLCSLAAAAFFDENDHPGI